VGETLVHLVFILGGPVKKNPPAVPAGGPYLPPQRGVGDMRWRKGRKPCFRFHHAS